MRKSTQAFTYLITLLIVFGAFVLYQQTFGKLTDYEQISAELLAPLADDPVQAVNPDMLRESELAAIRGFGPDCAELKAPLVLESRKKGDKSAPAQRGIGVFVYADDYEILKDNPRQIRLHPFSMIQIQPSTTANAEEDEISTIRGKEAILEFDRPIELNKVSGLKPMAGWVRGNVEMKSNRRTMDPTDDIVVFTERIDYREDKHMVWAEDQIQVVEQDARISGIGMELELYDQHTPGETKTRLAARRIRLLKDASFFLLMHEDDNFLGSAKDNPKGASPVAKKIDEPKAAEKPPALVPVKITSRGPFTYDLEAGTASFQQSVRVHRQNPAKVEGDLDPIDQLECDQLALKFRPKTADEAKAAPPPKDAKDKGPIGQTGGNMRLESATATGAPVILLSDSNHLKATGNYLFYDALTRKSVLKADQELVALHENAVIHGRSLVIEPGEGKTIRNFAADGPNGWLEIEQEQSGGKEKKKMKIRWQGRLTMSGKPGTDARLVTVTDNVELDDDRGAMKCDQLKVWLVAVDPPAGAPKDSKPKLEPIKIEATNNVSAKFDSMDVVTDSLNMDIVHLKETAAVVPAKETTAPAPAAVESTPKGTQPSPAKTSVPIAEPRKLASTPPKSASKPTAKPLEEKAVLATAVPKTNEESPLDVRAKRVAVVVERRGTKSTPIKAWAEGNVIVTQAPKEPGQQPLDIRGQTLDFNRTPNGDIVKVGGTDQRIAVVKTAEMTLAGRRYVQLNEVSNKVDVSGPGYLVLVSQNDLMGKKTQQLQEMTVEWIGGMEFDGKNAVFEQSVKAEQQTAKINCETMEVTFETPVNFRELRQQRAKRDKNAVKIDTVVCDKNVTAQNRENGPDGKFLRYVTTKVPELMIDNAHKTFEGKGPKGFVQIIEPNNKKNDANGKPIADNLVFLVSQVHFQGEMRGDQIKQVVKFYDRVHIVHTPVERLEDEINEDKLNENGIIVDAADHAIMAVRTGENAQKFRDFQAVGDVHVQARDFWGQADTLNYDQQKDLLTFKGSESQKARLFRQMRPGDAPEEFPARSIQFHRAQNRIKIDEADGFNAIIQSPDKKAIKPTKPGKNPLRNAQSPTP